MTFELPSLPYERNALEPFISAETISFHYEKHHATYLNNLNNLIKGSPLENETLENIILQTSKDPDKQGIFNNAAQVWNHTFYWKSLKKPTAEKNTITDSALLGMVKRDFGNENNLKEALKTASMGQFGSGWGWLVFENGGLKVIRTPNAQNPLGTAKPLLCIDVWEHAYYLDYKNKRADYLDNVIEHLLDWDFAAHNLNV